MAPQTGDAVALFQSMLSATWYGVVGDGATPGGMAATMEMIDDEAVITTDVLVGPEGKPGRNAPIVDMQWPPLQQAAELDKIRPSLGEKDKGKAWWIGTVVYVWTGTTFEMVRPGPAGPPGSTPQISVSAETIPMADRDPDTKDEVIQTGTSLNPHLHFKLLSPQGPVGPSTNILNAPDYDNAKAPTDGQTLTWSQAKQKWQPSSYPARQPKLYSVPESAFTSYPGGFDSNITVLSFTIPAQDYAWVPLVEGHIKAFGIQISADPLQIGCQVRLANRGNQLIGRGYGDVSRWTQIRPHFADAGAPTDAVSPENAVAVVRAGEDAQIKVQIVNDGLIGFYSYNRTGSHLTVQTIPHGL